MNSSAVDVLLQTTAVPSTTSWSQSFADEQKQNIIQTVISSLSIFGSLTIIITYFIFKDLQSTARKFLVYISIGDFFTVFPYLIGAWVNRNSIFCKVQSFVTTTAVMWSFFWTSSLAIYLYIVIVKKNREKADKLMPYFHVINWGLPLALLGAALGNGMLGSGGAKDSGGWCWIILDFGHDKAVWWMLACGKFWEILSYFVDVVLCFIVTRKINSEVKKRHNGLSSESTQAAIQGKRKLIWAPILFVFLRIWGTIRFLLFCFHHDKENVINEILIICHIIGDSSQGTVYFILFCLCTPKFRNNVRRMLCSCHKKKSARIERKGRPISSRNEEHKYLLQNPENIVFYT